jgi:hypothetical protein
MEQPNQRARRRSEAVRGAGERNVGVVPGNLIERPGEEDQPKAA